MTSTASDSPLARQAKKGFAGIIFDCDGVLIDASRSYELALSVSASAFGAILGLSFEEKDFSRVVETIRRLGTFNNDWDTLAVAVSYLYSQSRSRELLENIGNIVPASQRLREFESRSLALRKDSKKSPIDFEELVDIVRSCPMGASRSDLLKKILKKDELVARYSNSISYPAPVGESLLGTFFDEVMYGPEVFRLTYGFDCATTLVSKPGLITHESTLVSDQSLAAFSRLSFGNLGIITGRPRVPTMHTLGKKYEDWFKRPEICLFTGDYMLDVEEVKPSPKPMVRVAEKLEGSLPILYVGDSGEDILMARRANELLMNRIMFAAVAKTKEKAKFFEGQRDSVDCIVSDVNELPRVLESKRD